MTGAAVVAALALTATPARVQFDGTGAATVQVTNHGRQPVVLDVARAGFALDLRGRPRIVARARPAWLSFAPARVAIEPGEAAALVVRGRVPAAAGPGDRTAVLLLSSRPLAHGAIAVRMRLGLIVVLRVPGAVVRSLSVTAIGVRHHVLTLALANRGNVGEVLGSGRLVVSVWQHGRLRAHWRPDAREILPRAHSLVDVRCPRCTPGTAVVRVVVGSRTRSLRVRVPPLAHLRRA